LVWLAVGSVVLLGIGCASRPIAKVYRQQAAAEDVTFPMVLKNPDAYNGYVVLWGGTILHIKNLKDSAHITVLETPLHGSERPRSRSYSQGRFIARSEKLLDPEVYRRGEKITVAGVVSGKEVQPLGETTYTYPVIEVKQIVLWQRHYYRYAYPYDWWGPDWDYWWGPYGGPYWDRDPDFGYYGGDDEGFDRNEHEHFGGEDREEHGERDGDRR
jgi:outer membrane lipoprotein